MGSTLFDKWKILTAVWFNCCGLVFPYNFRNVEDEEACRKLKTVELSPYRTVSLTPMSWQSADVCCKMKGRILHTVETVDEFAVFPLKKVLPERVEDAINSQFWIGLSYRNANFHWTYGTNLRDSYRSSLMKERYKWAAGHPDSNMKCVGITPRNGTLDMYSISCSSKLKFICQKSQNNLDEPLSGHDIMLIGSAKFLDINEYSNLKFSKALGRWSLAKAICQARNWALIDRVHERYGKKLFREIAEKSYMFDESLNAIHSAANDFCESSNWKWNCGEDIPINTIPWSYSATYTSDYSQRNRKQCIQYYWESQLENFTSGKLVANNVKCDAKAYVICDTEPACDTDKQYPCLNNDPYYINVEELIDDDIKSCSNAIFQDLSPPHNNGTHFWVSATKFTWAGANKCCQMKGWKLPAPKNTHELEILAENTIAVAPSSLCGSEQECDGIWTAASTKGFSPYSPLRFSDGRVLSKLLYSSLRADGFTYPSCGRINYISFDGPSAKYFHAHCLEKNFLACESEVQQDTKPVIQGRSMLLSKNYEPEEDTVQFNQALQDKFNSPLTPFELQAREWELRRGRCLGDLEQVYENYKDSCPISATTVFPEDKPNIEGEFPISVQLLVEFQNRFLLESLVASLYGKGENYESDAEKQSFQLLTNSAMIFAQICPIVPTKIITKIFSIFRKLYEKMVPVKEQKPDMMSKDDFRWTIKLLTKCQELVKPLILKHDICGDMIISKDTCDNFICTKPNYESSLVKADSILDFMWKMFEVTHAACFPAFQENPMLHHMFAMSVVDLWESESLIKRWNFQSADKKFWIRLLGPKFDIYFINMERCNEAIIQNSMFHVRLPRSSVPPSVRIQGFPYEKL